MALVAYFKCTCCQTEKLEVVRPDNVCSVCRESVESNRRRLFLENRQKYSIEQRLGMIEAAIYDLNAEQRLKALEAKNATYC